MSSLSQLLILSKGQDSYESSRKRYFNARLPNIHPTEIAVPITTQDTTNAVLRAKSLGLKVGVRSGGHLFPACSLIQNGLLIDTSNLNRGMQYDPNTQVMSFGPCTRSKEAAEYLTQIGRFFPFGHSPTVAAGGFLLAGGQGWFMRGWGLTCESWVLKLEVVMPDGRVIESSREEYQDVFWAARGSGQGFFGVVTRIWVRTIPQRKLFNKLVAFEVRDDFEAICSWIFKINAETPKYGVEIAASTFFPDRNNPPLRDKILDDKLVLGVSVTIYADTLEEATTLSSATNHIPEKLKKNILVEVPCQQTTWEQLFLEQDELNPYGNGERWQCDSILTDPKIPYDKLAAAIKPVMCDLPSRRSIGCIYIGDHVADESNAAVSISQQYYVASMTCWTDPEDDDKMRAWMYDTFTKVEHVSLGQYIADFDVTQRQTKVMSDSALQRWLAIRQRWDPEEMFPAYRGFAAVLKGGTRL